MRDQRSTLAARAKTHHGVHHLIGATRPAARCVNVQREHLTQFPTPNSQFPTTPNSQCPKLPTISVGIWELEVVGSWKLVIGNSVIPRAWRISRTRNTSSSARS